MKRKKLRCLISLFGTIFWLHGTCLPQDAVAPSSRFFSDAAVRSTFAVRAAPGAMATTDQGLGIAEFQFGIIKSNAAIPIDHVFVLTNPCERTLKITAFRSSCACTSATALPTQHLPLSVAPHHSISIEVHVDTGRMAPGNYVESVQVLVEGQNVPAATLEMTGAVAGPITLSPSELDFGDVVRGSSPEKCITVFFDAGIESERSSLNLVSSNSNVKIAKAEQLASHDRWETRCYEVSISPTAPCGLLTGTLCLRTRDAGSESPVVGNVIAIRARVIGAVTLSEDDAVIYRLAQSECQPKRIRLTGVETKDIRLLRISTASPILEAKLISQMDSHDASEIYLEISLIGASPLGALRTEVIFRTPDGTEYVIPVTIVTYR